MLRAITEKELARFKNALFAVDTAAMLFASVAAQAGTVAWASTGKIANLSGLGERRSAPFTAKKQGRGRRCRPRRNQCRRALVGPCRWRPPPPTAEWLPKLVVWRQDFTPSLRTIDTVKEQA
ncbi:hypothetical protein V474_12860 [Novosphingobium barchaimii LL02]|uniref:Uncharacterized protein n=1 Tax=Novosphingobium barchaimii LL02 TaxID=1114963 RepID=A0A0J7Y4U0_9SPHN|nr:hypothetical protein [Novosphingobium barchaimii]KMS58926.1 hypothetical protein V474_12860 [Novosphingobium barchaimii LL02]